MKIERAKGHGRYATISIDMPGDMHDRHVKLRPSSHITKLSDEAARTKWARDRLPVPADARAFRLPGVALLITKTLDGRPSYNYIDTLEPPLIIAGVSRAVQTMRQATTEDFPFAPPQWTTVPGVRANVQQLTTNKNKHRELHPDFADRTFHELKDIVDAGPDDTKKVLSHGDLCMPNVLLNTRGNMTGIVDLGGLHVGNQHLDLAVMSWTIEANMGAKWSDHLLGLHGATNIDQGILYNRLAYDLGLEQPHPWAWTQTDRLIEQRARLSEEWSEQ